MGTKGAYCVAEPWEAWEVPLVLPVSVGFPDTLFGPVPPMPEQPQTVRTQTVINKMRIRI
jgi:hypothetical protein